MESLKTRMARKDLTIGSWLSFGFVQTCEMMAKAKFDWLAIDMEHSAITTAEMQQMIQIIDLAGKESLVRVGANDPLLIKHAMDAGANGVIVPMVNSVDDARRAADALYYPPRGQRGVGLSRAQGYGLDFDGYRKRAEAEAVLVVQIEHVDAVHALEDILALDEVDAFIVGPYDLSASIGKAGQLDDPELHTLIDRVIAVAADHAKPGGFHIVLCDHAALSERIERGCRFMAFGTDMVMFAEKLRDETSPLDKLRR